MPAGAVLQRQFETMVAVDSKLEQLAKEAYLSYVRAYAAYPKLMKPIFHPKKLHLGHVARNFALTEPPKTIGSAAKAPKTIKTNMKNMSASKHRQEDGDDDDDDDGDGGRSGGSSKRKRQHDEFQDGSKPKPNLAKMAKKSERKNTISEFSM